MSKIEYAPCGDYLLPLITLNESPPELVEPLGRYARMQRSYLREQFVLLILPLMSTVNSAIPPPSHCYLLGLI